MKFGLAGAAFCAGICFAVSSASAGQGERNNINWLAGKSDAYISNAAKIAGDMVAVFDKCRFKPTDGGKAILTLPVILYNGMDKNLTPDRPKFQRAIRVYERAFAIAVQRSGDCRTEKARHPGLYR